MYERGVDFIKHAEYCGHGDHHNIVMKLVLVGVGWLFLLVGSFTLIAWGSIRLYTAAVPIRPVVANVVPTVPPISILSKRSLIEDAIKDKVEFRSTGKWSDGSVLMLNFSLYNHGTVDVKDIKITCSLEGESGTNLGKATNTVYVIVKSKAFKEFSGFNMGFAHPQTHNVYCVITDLVLL